MQKRPVGLGRQFGNLRNVPDSIAAEVMQGIANDAQGTPLRVLEEEYVSMIFFEKGTSQNPCRRKAPSVPVKNTRE